MAIKKSIDELILEAELKAKQLKEKKVENKLKPLFSLIKKNHKYFDDDYIKKMCEHLEKHINDQKNKNSEEIEKI